MIPTFLADRENKKRRGEDENVTHVGGGSYTYTPADDDDEDEIVLEAGGAPAPPPPPDPGKEADARIREEEARARLQEQAAERERQRLAAEKLQNIEKTKTRAQQAYNDALGYGTSQLNARGIDPMAYGVMDLYRSSIDLNRGRIPEITEDPSSFLNSSQAFQDAWNQATSTQRRNYTKQYNQTMGDGFADSVFADEADDAYLDSILSEQYTDANDEIERAYARGRLNDAGKTYAAKQLERAKLRGRATAEDLGLGVLQGYRGQLTNEAGKIKKNIDAYELGDDFNLDAGRSRVDALTGRLRNRLEGDIYNAVGGTEFFDTDAILGKAGTRSGVMNASGGVGTGSGLANLSAALSPTEDPNKKNSGNGVF